MANQEQVRYWKEFFKLKKHINYLDLYHEHSEVWDRRINIYLAITSSGSIASWVIWQKLGILWAILIATSQVIVAIKSYLPYNRRIKILANLYYELLDFSIDVEKKWYDISKGKLTEEQINKSRIEIKSKKAKILKKHLGQNSLPIKDKLSKKAEEQSIRYFKDYYGG